MSAAPSDSASAPPRSPPSPAHPLRQWTITVLKLAIAVVGIWWVVSHTSWNDAATIAAGNSIRTATFTQETPVTVLKETLTPRRLITVQFPPKPIVVNMDGRQQEVMPSPDGVIPTVIDLSPDYFKTDGAEIVHQGIHTLLIEASARWYLLVIAWALLVTPFLVTAIRWRGLLRPQGINLPFSRCLQLTFVGQFYSILLPGVTGGDLVKIIYTARLTGSKTKSLITILLDRVIGLIALMTIAAASSGIQLLLNCRAGLPLDGTLFNVFIMIVALMACLGVGGFVYFSHRLRRLVGIDWFITTFGSTTDPEATHHQHDKLEALFRAVNLLVLGGAIVVGGTAATLRWGSTSDWAMTHHGLLLFVVIVMGLAAIGALVGLAMHTLLVDRMMPLLIRGVGSVIRVDGVLHTYRGHFGLLFWAFLISLPSQLTLPLSAYLSGLAFGMTPNVTYYLAYVPVAVLAASLPISPPQGFGFMDWILFHFFVERGNATAGQAIALAQSIRFLPILWNLLGGYWVVTGQYSRQQTASQERELPPEPDIVTPLPSA